ncbi:MAG: hypothetical protein FJ293_01620 [Planctomycetes bacterium]|nr:hypothetical protein [Planctomycetota bacterium]
MRGKALSARVPSESTFQIGASTGRAIAMWIATLPKTMVLAVIALSPLFVWNFLSGGYGDDSDRDPSLTLVDKLLEALLGSVVLMILVPASMVSEAPGST